MKSSKLIYWSFILIAGVVILFVFPEIAKNFDRVSFETRDGKPLGMFLCLIIGVGIIVPFLCLAVLSAQRLPKGYEGNNMLRYLPLAIIVMSLAPTIFFPSRLYSYGRQPCTVVVKSEKMGVDLVNGLALQKNLQALNYDQINMDKLFEIAARTHYFRGNLYVAELQTDLGTVMELRGVMKKGGSTDLGWESIQPIEVQKDSAKDFYRQFSEDITQNVQVKFEAHNLERTLALYTDNSEALGDYLEGLQQYSQYTKEGLKNGIRLFSNAVEIDPDFSLPYAGLADCHCQLFARYWNHTEETLQLAKAYVHKAESLGNSAVIIQKAAGFVHQCFACYHMENYLFAKDETQKRHSLALAKEEAQKAIEKYQKSIQAAPNCPIARNNLSSTYLLVAKIHKTEQDIGRAKQYLKKADAILSEGLRRNPFFPPFYLNRGALLLCELAILQDTTRGLINNSVSYTRQGIEYSKEESHKSYGFFNLACAYSILGAMGNSSAFDSSLAYLDTSFTFDGFNLCLVLTGDNDLHVRFDSDLIPLRKTKPKEFQELLERHGCFDPNLALSLSR